jgi:hypothetical protein
MNVGMFMLKTASHSKSASLNPGEIAMKKIISAFILSYGYSLSYYLNHENATLDSQRFEMNESGQVIVFGSCIEP